MARFLVDVWFRCGDAHCHHAVRPRDSARGEFDVRNFAVAKSCGNVKSKTTPDSLN